MPHVGVSAKIGKGYHTLLPKVAELRKEYFDVFLPELMGSESKGDKAEMFMEPVGSQEKAPEAQEEDAKMEQTDNF